MKQSELDRELGGLVRAAARRHGWKSVGGMSYKASGPLFFVLIPVVRAREGAFHASLRVKWLDLDRGLWRVLDMAGNERAPSSLHANGAFVLRGHEILEVSRRDLDGTPGILARLVEEVMVSAASRSAEVAGRIGSVHAWLEFARHEHEALLRRFPGAAADIWKEELLVALETGDLDTAAQIARSRVAAGDTGGFTSGGRSFYERALALCSR